VAITAYRKLRRKLSRIKEEKIKGFILANMSEQVPNPHSRLTLSGERDKFGLNRVQLNWQLSEIDLLSVIRTQQIIDEELRRARLGQTYIQLRDTTPPANLHGGYHHMGTTRMHRDPKKGVVNENCQVHGISNLFIAGPSVFPTGGYANPVLTIIALSVRLADHVKKIMMGTSYTIKSEQTANT
jgi:choline dehydrogenase-like flavoprotein